jgi:hypothetical protein
VNRVGPASLRVRYQYVATLIGVAVIYGLVLISTVGWTLDSRKSLAAFFTIPLSLALLGFAAFGKAFEGRHALVVTAGAFGFVPVVAVGAWQRIEIPIVWPAEPDPTGGIVSFFVTMGLFLAIAGAAPHVVQIENFLDRVVRILAPAFVVAEVAMFAVAITRARRPDPDTFLATLPEPRPIDAETKLAIGGKTLQYVVEREGCHVLDEANVAYTDAFGCKPVTVTFDEGSKMVMVRRDSMWSSSKALRPPDVGGRLAAPVGWTHLAGGGALLASLALVLATAFARRARAVEEPSPHAAGGYRVPAPMPGDEDPATRQRDFYDARARGARFVALTVAASTGLPLAAALAHGVGR